MLRTIAALLVMSACAFGQQASRYRSHISICDRESGAVKELFTAETIFEAPNWSHDGKFLLANSGGSLYRIPLDNPVPEKLDVGSDVRCNNDHGYSFDGKRLVVSCTSAGGCGS
ncbi:MAG TPA: hypothetical protein VGF59_29315 [Bryobacteraceae bacterium]